ncbi:hypothetical protein LX97_03257 [Nonlabens dokdonensis]|jgi:hypothetical protein|uniref:Uncharacterized protein n=2 Tax=Nonlabens dokdonensis TaxID=328515 RepID=L7WAK6_NONDD|nr:hypothetical protein [Nonlabens dokdonensis]AGC76886.1 hypothetical protein DDD_1759 [Nonlabens dokdonensis DSW-6]PZX36795.1 hypothetical protein LX97_03257 [Nonlabens dokdonensis]
MKTTLTLIIAFIILTSFTKVEGIIENSFKIDEDYKVEGTFSGNTQGEDSFHFIIAKHKENKNYHILPFQFKNEKVIKMEPIVFDEQPSVLSFHNNGDQLSVITSYKDRKSRKFQVVDVNLTDQSFTKSAVIDGENYKTTLREKNQNFLVFSEKESLKIITVKSANEIKDISIKATDANEDFLKSLHKNNLDAISSQEYVENGSINDFRIYSNNGTITITQEKTKDGTTNLAQINTNSDTIEELVISNFKSKEKGKGKLKKSTSYVSENKLFLMNLKKENATLDIHDLNTKSSKQLDILSTDIANASSNKAAVGNFLKNATKGKNQPTVTVNQAKNGQLKLRVDYVNKKMYSYNYNWWWHHHWMMQQQMWMMQQQQNQMIMQNNMRRFGPNGSEGYPIYIFKKKSESFFEIALNSEGNIIPANEVTTIHKNIDKEFYIKEIDNNKKLKHSSTVFTETTFRYISYNKKSKTFVIKSKPLDY